MLPIEELNKAYETALQSVNDIMDEIKVKIKDFEKQQEEEKPSRRRKPKTGENFFFIYADGIIDSAVWVNSYSDNLMYSLGNCFKTKEEAEFAVEQLKVLAELKEYADDTQEGDGINRHYFLYYDFSNSVISGGFVYRVKYNNAYFSSEEQIRKAIDAIGEDRLKKYYFCVED